MCDNHNTNLVCNVSRTLRGGCGVGTDARGGAHGMGNHMLGLWPAGGSSQIFANVQVRMVWSNFCAQV